MPESLLTDAPRTRGRSVIAALVAVAAFALTACASGGDAPASAAASSAAPEPTPVVTPAPDPVTMSIASMKAPTTMGLVGLIDAVDKGTAGEDYQVTMYGAPDEVVPLVAQGQVDIALIPANLAAVLYNKTKGTDSEISVLAVNTLGVLNIVENGETITSLEDLRGRTIFSTGKGASPEYVLNHLLAASGMTPGVDVTVEYLSEHTEVMARLTQTPGSAGLLPQPFVTIGQAKNADLRVALDLTEEWNAVSPESQLITGVVVVRNAFAAEHPEAVAQFMTEYEASTQWVNANPADAGVLIANAGIVPEAALAAKAIPNCYITFIAGAELKTALSGYLQVLFDADPASVGGSLPGDDFYYAG